MATHSIEKWARRDFQKKSNLYAHFVIAWYILFVSSVIFFVTTVFNLTNVAEAHEYPTTVQGACMQYRDVGGRIYGASVEEVKEYCKELGVDI